MTEWGKRVRGGGPNYKHSKRFFLIISVLLSFSTISLLLPAAGAAESHANGSPKSSSSPDSDKGASIADDPALKEGDRREIEEMRTQNSRTFSLSSGAYEAEIYTGSIHYKEDGEWETIDNTLVSTDRPGYAFENKANDYKLLIPEDISKRDIRVESSDGNWISFAPEGASGRPVVDGDTATFVDAIGDVDFSYSARSDSVEEALELEDASIPDSYTFDFNTSAGVDASQDASGEIQFSEHGEELDFKLGSPFMYEMTGDLQDSRAVSVDLYNEGDSEFIELDPRDAWLASDRRDYPVVIDPPVIFPSEAQDCWIGPEPAANPIPANDDQCTSGGLRIGYASNYGYRRALLNFPLKGGANGGLLVPRQSTVLNARLQLFRTQVMDAPYVKDVSIHRITDDWSGQANWTKRMPGFSWAANGGDFDPAKEDVVGTVGDEASEVWNPTRIVQDWVDRSVSDHNGFLLKVPNQNVNAVARFGSLESSTGYQPKLTVTYADWHGMASRHHLETQPLNDKMTLGVNVANGNLVLQANDLKIGGTAGHDLNIVRTYNSSRQMHPDTPAYRKNLGGGWSMSPAPDVYLEVYRRDVAFYGPGRDVVRFKQKQDSNGNWLDAQWESKSFPNIDAKLTQPAAGEQMTVTMNSSKMKYVFDPPQAAVARLRYIRDKEVTVSPVGNREGNEIEFGYDANARLAWIDDTQERRTTFHYYNNPSGNLEKITDPAGRVHRFQYSNNNAGDLLTTYADPENYQRMQDEDTTPTTPPDCSDPNQSPNYCTRYAYDPTTKQLTKITDPKGNETHIVYNADAKVFSVQRRTNPSSESQVVGPITKFTYGPFDNGIDPDAITTVTNPNGQEISYPDHQVAYTYDRHGRVTETRVAGQFISKTPYEGTKAEVEGQPDPDPYAKDSDASAHVMSYTSAEGEATKFQFNNDGAVTEMDSPTYGKITMGYNAESPFFPVTTTSSQGITCDAHYGAQGTDEHKRGNLRRVTCKDGDNLTTDPQFWYDYDLQGNITRIDPPANCLPPDRQTTGRELCLDTSQGNDTLFEYYQNATGTFTNLKKVDRPGSQSTLFEYFDGSGEPSWLVEKMTDGKGQASTYKYDKVDRLIEVTFHNGSKVNYKYDPNGNLIERVDPSGTTTWTYDKVNRLGSWKFDPSGSAGEESTDFTYDPAGNLKSVTGSGGTTTYHYNERELLSSMHLPQNGGSVSFGYNRNGDRTSTVYPNRTVMTVDYVNVPGSSGAPKDTSKINTIEGWKGDSAQPVDLIEMLTAFNYDYKSVSTKETSMRESVITKTFRDTDGEKTAYEYENFFGSLKKAHTTNGTSGSGTFIEEYLYEYDDRGNIQKKTHDPGPNDPAVVTTYGYNAANQLISRTIGSQPAVSFDGYDANGNFTGTTASDYALAYNDRDQTTSIDTPASPSALGPIEYSDFMQDERVSTGSSSFRYNVLGLGRENDSSGNYHYIRDSAGTLVAIQKEKDGNDDDFFFYLFDGLGSVAAVTDEPGSGETRGDVVALYEYDPYGKTTCGLAQQSDCSQVKNPWRYASGYYDTQTDIYKFGTRFYDPNLMRWTQVDPKMGRLAQPMSLNSYAYVAGNPVNSIDPSGRDGMLIPSLPDLVGAGLWDVWTDASLGAAAGCIEYGAEGAEVGVAVPIIGPSAGATAGCGIGVGISSIEYYVMNVYEPE